MSIMKEMCPKMEENSLQDAISRRAMFQAKDFNMDAALKSSRKIIRGLCKVNMNLQKAIGNMGGSVIVIYGELDDFESPDDMRALERASKGCLRVALQTHVCGLE